MIHLCVCVNEIKAHKYYVRFTKQMKIKIQKYLKNKNKSSFEWMDITENPN